jgi:hypothetical protein
VLVYVVREVGVLYRTLGKGQNACTSPLINQREGAGGAGAGAQHASCGRTPTHSLVGSAAGKIQRVNSRLLSGVGIQDPGSTDPGTLVIALENEPVAQNKEGISSLRSIGIGMITSSTLSP